MPPLRYIDDAVTLQLDVERCNGCGLCVAVCPRAVFVIAGHSGYRNGATAAFDDLQKLRKGDLVFVKDAEGVLARFIVRASRTFDRRAKPAGVFEDGSTNGRHLNLVTCTGAWNAAAGTHADRLIVYTDALW